MAKQRPKTKRRSMAKATVRSSRARGPRGGLSGDERTPRPKAAELVRLVQALDERLTTLEQRLFPAETPHAQAVKRELDGLAGR